MARGEAERGVQQAPILLVDRERAQTPDAEQGLVDDDPVEDLVEEAGIVARDLERQEEERLGVLRPRARRWNGRENAELSPLAPGEVQQRPPQVGGINSDVSQLSWR